MYDERGKRTRRRENRVDEKLLKDISKKVPVKLNSVTCDRRRQKVTTSLIKNNAPELKRGSVIARVYSAD